jgi:hypothetical protein
LGYWIVPNDNIAIALSARRALDWFGYRTVLHDSTAISPRVNKAAERDGSRPVPLILDADRPGHRTLLVSFLMLGRGRLRRLFE